jgi:hypothetical protein
LVLANGYPISDALEVLKSNSSSGVFGLTHNRLADDVVRVGLKSLLPPSELLEMSLCALRSSRLKGRPELGYPRSDGENFGSRVGFTIGVEGKVADAEINPEPPFDLPLFRVRNIHRNEKVETSVSKYKVRLTSVVDEKLSLVISTDEGDSLSSSNHPDAHGLLDPGEDASIIGDGTERTEDSLGLPVQLVAIRHLRDAANDHLGREVGELGTAAIIGKSVKGKLTEGFGFPSLCRKPVTSLICSTDRRSQRRSLLRRRLELNLCRELHTLIMVTSMVEVNPSCTISLRKQRTRFLPAVNGGVSAREDR